MIRPHADTLWSQRLMRIKLVTGWSNGRIAEEMGSATLTVRKVFLGKRPIMRTIMKIKALEVRCEPEFEAQARGEIIVDKHGRRFDFRTVRHSRPHDLAALEQPMELANGLRGAVAALRGVGRLPFERRRPHPKAD